MAGEFPMLPIGEFADVFSGFAFKSEDFTDSGLPVVKIKNVNNRVVDPTDTEHFPMGRVTAKHTKFFLKDRDVLIAMTGQGSVGRVGRIRLDGNRQVLLNQRVGKFVTDPDKLDLAYLFYVISTPSYERILFDAGSGSGQPNLSPSIICSVKIPVPPISEQRAIAHILGMLDDKIELNRRMNETLEAMARALFHSWFVDFDPVRAKAEGRDPGLPKPIADLFPGRLVDSELGEIPEGWEVRCVDDEFALTMGQSPPGETYNEVGEGIPFYQGRADFGSRFPTRRMFCTAPTRLAKAGDTLISVRAPVGDINMATEDCAIGRGIAAARHRSGSRSYSYQFMLGLEEVFARFEAEGTVFGSIGKKDFHAIPCAKPPRTVIAEFEATLSPFDSRIDVTERESRTLAALRDTLLPKLISGELRLQDAGKMLADAAV